MIRFKFKWWDQRRQPDELTPLDEELLKKLRKLAKGDYVIYALDGKQNRSLPQLRYYWGVILKQVEDQIGYEKEEIHRMMKHMFGLRTITIIGNYSFEEIQGWRQMSKADGAEFTEKVTRYWTEQGVVFTFKLDDDQYVTAHNEILKDID